MRKELKKQAKAAAAPGTEEGSDDEGSEVAFDGIAALQGAKRAASSSKAKISPTVEDVEDEEAPALIPHEYPDMKSLLEAADVVVEPFEAIVTLRRAAGNHKEPAERMSPTFRSARPTGFHFL